MLWKLLHPDAKVVATDMPDLLPQLQANLDRNFEEFSEASYIRAEALDWSREGILELIGKHSSFDICLNCDCIYEPLYGRDSWEALADVLAAMAEASPSTVLVTSVERRRGDGLELFMERLKAAGTVGDIERVLRDDSDKHHVIEIYVTQGKAK